MSTSVRAIVVLASSLCLLPKSPAAEAPKNPPAMNPPAVASGAKPGADNSTEDESTNPAPPKIDPSAVKFWEAVKLLGSKKPNEIAEGRTALRSAADLEYTHAQVLLANCLLTGSYGFSKDARKGANLFRLAAARGNAFAKVSLGQCYFTGTGVWKDLEKSAEWLTAALAPGADFSRPEPPADFFKSDSPGKNSGNDETVAGSILRDPVGESKATAHFLLGVILAQKKNLSEAHAHYLAAARAGPAGRDGLYPAALQAALDFAFGYGVARDLNQANELLELSIKLTAKAVVSRIHNYVALKLEDDFAAADLEESVARSVEGMQTNLQFQIASTFANKKSKDYNVAEAAKWFELAANNGQTWAMLSLAFIYADEKGGRYDPAKAFQWFEKAGSGDKPKHYLAAGNLGICYQQGFGTAKDPVKAAEVFKLHREHFILSYLGSIGQAPARPQTYEESMALQQLWAKDKKDANAQFLMGLRYLGQWDVPADFSESVKWLKKAAQQNHAAAWCELGLIYELYPWAIDMASNPNRMKEVLDCYQKGADLGNVDAMVNLANMFEVGSVVPRDSAKAETLYLKALKIQPDNGRAHNALGVVYQHRLEKLPSTKTPEAVETRTLMLQHYEKAVELKFAHAANNLGLIYSAGKLLDQDYHRAYGYFEQATEWGLPLVHYTLGRMHEFGQGVPITYSEAAYHYRLAALEGHVDALRGLINFYLTGQGVSMDLERATFWLRILVQRGYPQAMTTLCDVMLQRGQYDQAFKLLKELSDVSDRELAGYACERLFRCYQQGWGTKVNPAKATKYFDQAVKYQNGSALARLAMQQMKEGKIKEALANLHAAARTSREANYYLGQMYYFGTNVEKDTAKAVSYMREAADRNNVDALYFLAAMTFNREAGAPEMDEAIRFAEQAETAGMAKATELREKLERRRKAASAAPEETAKARSS